MLAFSLDVETLNGKPMPAQAEEGSEEIKKNPAKGKKWLMIIAIITSVLIAGGIAAYFLIAKKPPIAGKEEKEQPPKPAFYLSLDRFVVNIAKSKRSRYLQLNVDVLVREEKFLQTLQTHLPKIKNNLVFLLSNLEEEQIFSAEGKDTLRKQVLKEIQNIMEEEIGKPTVEDVFFTNFVVQ